MESVVNDIYEHYLSPTALQGVNIDSKARAQAERDHALPSNDSFDDAARAVFKLMSKDTYRRFLLSPRFKELLGGRLRASVGFQGAQTLQAPNSGSLNATRPRGHSYPSLADGATRSSRSGGGEGEGGGGGVGGGGGGVGGGGGGKR